MNHISIVHLEILFKQQVYESKLEFKILKEQVSQGAKKILKMSATLEELNQYWDSIIAKAQEMKQQMNQEMEKKLQEIKEEQNKLDVLTNKVKQVSPLVKDVVKLNVGGKKFATSRDNLLKEPSFFTGLLSANFAVERDEKGAIFIDRNPKYFQFILDYLRNEKIDLKLIDAKEHSALLEEIQFYEIGSLIAQLVPSSTVEPLQFLPEYVTERITLSDNNTSLTVADGGTKYDCAMLCDKRATRWKVIIKRIQSANGGFCLGVANKDSFKKSGKNYSGTNTYLLCSNGNFIKPGGDHKSICGQLNINGCEVEVLYKNGTLAFKLDGKDLGEAASGVPDNLYPAFDFLYGCSISIQQLE